MLILSFGLEGLCLAETLRDFRWPLAVMERATPPLLVLLEDESSSSIHPELSSPRRFIFLVLTSRLLDVFNSLGDIRLLESDTLTSGDPPGLDNGDNCCRCCVANSLCPKGEREDGLRTPLTMVLLTPCTDVLMLRADSYVGVLVVVVVVMLGGPMLRFRGSDRPSKSDPFKGCSVGLRGCLAG